MKNLQDVIKNYIRTLELEDPVILFETPDYCTAFLGVDMEKKAAIYDYGLMLEYLILNYGFTSEEAEDYITKTIPYKVSIYEKPIILKRWTE